jgi:hypothetical protein
VAFDQGCERLFIAGRHEALEQPGITIVPDRGAGDQATNVPQHLP